MTPYQLKRSILYLAIQGNLLPHNPCEGTGFDLLKANAKQTHQIASGTRVKIGKCKDINDDDILFSIPDNWAWERFGNLVINYDSQRRPVSKSDRESINGYYHYYGATGAIDKVDNYIFTGDYLMIGEDGGNFYTERDNSFIANGKFWANNHVHVVQPIICDIWFMKYCLDSYNLPAMGLINGIAVPKLNQENMNSIMIPVPPLAEQKRIVAKIEELLPYIDRYEQAWSKLEDFNKCFPTDMQKSILQMAIQGKLVEQHPEEGTGEELYRQIQAEKQKLIKAGTIKKEVALPEITEDEKPFDVPENWKWVSLQNIALAIVDCPHSTPRYYEYGTSYHTIDTTCIDPSGTITGWRYVDEPTYMSRISRLEPKRNDIVYTREGSICRAAILPSSMKICLGQRVMLIRCSESVLPQYLRRFLMSPYTVLSLTAKQRGIGAKHVNVSDVCSLMFPLPPLAEQKRIMAILDLLMPMYDRLSQFG